MNIFKKVLGNINNIDLNELTHYHIEKIIIDNDDLLKKMIVGYTDHHREISIVLDNNSLLKDGDIIFMDDHSIVVVVINTDKLIEIIPIDMNQMGYIAHNLGNRHIPCQFIDNKIYLIYDRLIAVWLDNNSCKFNVVHKKLNQPFKYANLS